ncbi:MAG: VWA domain-containing protein [Actinomycetia bacterium]|nr:VWA domain-containing protein [Actinomycetes bacterium]
MLSLLTDFVEELRTAGVPVSMVETIDATEALAVIDLADRSALKTALGATMVKSARHLEAFDTAFEVFFALDRPPPPQESQSSPVLPSEASSEGGSAGGGASLAEALAAALGSQDWGALSRLVEQAVEELAGMTSGRPVGGAYYLYRTLRRLDLDLMREMLVEMMEMEGSHPGIGEDALGERLRSEQVDDLLERLRRELMAEIRRRLVADRGRQPVAATLRSPPLEEVDLMHASESQLRRIEELIGPLTRKLAARLARRDLHRHRGRLDFRRTVRASLGTGGVPLDLRFRSLRRFRPEIFLLCDVSGSMATFARFTLQFTYAMSARFSSLRAFAFVDGVDEITHLLSPGLRFGDVAQRIFAEAEVVELDGHSDYGNALSRFSDRYAGELTARSTVIIAGDARNNYRDFDAQPLAEAADAAEAIYWLNPEPRAYWNTGDSLMARMGAFCAEVYEVRNLSQLEHFVEELADHRRRPPARRIRPSVAPSVR